MRKTEASGRRCLRGHKSRREAVRHHHDKIQQLLQDGFVSPPKLSLQFKDSGMSGYLRNPPNESIDLAFKAEVCRRPEEVSEDVKLYLSKARIVEAAADQTRKLRDQVQEKLMAFPGGHARESLRSWAEDMAAFDLSALETTRPVKILVYGGTGEGKSSLISVVVDMPGVSPSDCLGLAVTSCTTCYSFRPHYPSTACKPQ